MKIDQNLTFSLNFLANKIWQIHLGKHDINALMETGICQTLQETALQTNSSADFNYIPQKWFMVLKYSANNKIWECWPPPASDGVEMALLDLPGLYLLSLHVLHLLLQTLVLDFQVCLFPGQVVYQFPGLC